MSPPTHPRTRPLAPPLPILLLLALWWTPRPPRHVLRVGVGMSHVGRAREGAEGARRVARLPPSVAGVENVVRRRTVPLAPGRGEGGGAVRATRSPPPQDRVGLGPARRVGVPPSRGGVNWGRARGLRSFAAPSRLGYCFFGPRLPPLPSLSSFPRRVEGPSSPRRAHLDGCVISLPWEGKEIHAPVEVCARGRGEEGGSFYAAQERGEGRGRVREGGQEGKEKNGGRRQRRQTERASRALPTYTRPARRARDSAAGRAQPDPVLR